jgi:ferredoxin
MRITADSTRCVGAGQCRLAAPDIFDRDDESLVVVANGSPNDSELFRVHQAVIRCPTGAITVDHA